MTVNGGLLIYGVDEDKEKCTATALLPFPIAGLEEKIRGVAGTRISPTPDFRVGVVASPEDDTQGIVVVAIPASSLAEDREGVDAERIDALIAEASRALDRLVTLRRCHTSARNKIHEAASQVDDLGSELEGILARIRAEIESQLQLDADALA